MIDEKHITMIKKLLASINIEQLWKVEDQYLLCRIKHRLLVEGHILCRKLVPSFLKTALSLFLDAVRNDLVENAQYAYYLTHAELVESYNVKPLC